jgi:lipoprotein NlpD
MTEQLQLTGLKTMCVTACRQGVLWGVLAASVVLTGCGSRVSLNRAPVEDRGTPTSATTAGTLPSTSTATTVTLKPLPGIENAGKPGYYTIRPGDTIIRIALETGQNWRDIARWNGLDNANIIEVGQVLRVIPPVAGTVVAATPPTAGATGANPVSSTGEVTPGAFIPRPVATPTPVVASSIPPVGSRTTSAPAATASAVVTPALPTPAASTPAASAGDDDVAWIWPSTGSVIAGFDEVKNKGLDIAGKLGDPVYAAGDGRVVYAGSGLRGYGNLIILKHNNTYLTAYAHNQTLLVKEDQTVRKGQKIAEIGQSDADRVKLHFEIRRQGKPVDPSRYLPAR